MREKPLSRLGLYVIILHVFRAVFLTALAGLVVRIHGALKHTLYIHPLLLFKPLGLANIHMVFISVLHRVSPSRTSGYREFSVKERIPREETDYAPHTGLHQHKAVFNLRIDLAHGLDAEEAEEDCDRRIEEREPVKIETRTHFERKCNR